MAEDNLNKENEENEETITESRLDSKKHNKKYKVILLIIIAIISIFISVGIGVFIFFSSHFLPNTTINNLDISYMTIDKAYDKVNSELIDTFPTEITIIDSISNEEINITLPKAYKYSKQDLENDFKNKGKDIIVELNENYTKELRKSLEEISLSKGEKSKDAYIEFNKDKFEIVNDITGTEIDKEKLIESILSDSSDLLISKDNKVEWKTVYETKDFYKKANLRSDNKEIKSEVEKLNNRIGKDIVLKIKDDEYKIPTKTLVSFINEEDGEINAEKVYNWVQYDLDPQFSSVSQGVSFKNVHGQKLKYSNIQGTGWGWDINYPSARDKIIKAMNSDKKSETLTLDLDGNTESSSVVTKDYIEVDLKNQMVYMILDGKVAMESQTITGRATNKGTASVAGFHTILYGVRDTSLKGESLDGSKYSVPVKYFMPILSYGGAVTGIGFHDADYKSEWFGDKTAYRTDALGSNGCYNMPLVKAKFIYDNMYEGMPVFVYGDVYDNSPGNYDKPVENPQIIS